MRAGTSLNSTLELCGLGRVSSVYLLGIMKAMVYLQQQVGLCLTMLDNSGTPGMLWQQAPLRGPLRKSEGSMCSPPDSVHSTALQDWWTLLPGTSITCRLGLPLHTHLSAQQTVV